jgi:hypothetical protein
MMNSSHKTTCIIKKCNQTGAIFDETLSPTVVASSETMYGVGKSDSDSLSFGGYGAWG